MKSRAENGKNRLKNERGFSLLELLTVLVILGVFAAVSVPAISRILNNISVRNKTQNIVATLRYARLMSISKGAEVRLALDIYEEGGAFQLSGAVQESRNLNLGEEESLSMEPQEIIFFPESHATIATFVVVIGNQTREITIDPLTALPLIN
jgi:prepilin-type N-terminal cleavage/methylation domain-containing protein